jgi:hypothetical protein
VAARRYRSQLRTSELAASEARAAVQRRDGEISRLTELLSAAQKHGQEQASALAHLRTQVAGSGLTVSNTSAPALGELLVSLDHDAAFLQMDQSVSAARAASLAGEVAVLRSQLALLQPRAEEAAILADRLQDTRDLVSALETRCAKSAAALVEAQCTMNELQAEAVQARQAAASAAAAAKFVPKSTPVDHSECMKKLQEAESRAKIAELAAAFLTVHPPQSAEVTLPAEDPHVPASEVAPDVSGAPTGGPVISRSQTASLSHGPPAPASTFSFRVDAARIDELRGRNVGSAPEEPMLFFSDTRGY